MKDDILNLIKHFISYLEEIDRNGKDDDSIQHS